jgi:hypothetical protein
MEKVSQPGEKTKEVAPSSPEDMAAHDYKVLMPKFWDKIEPMSRRQQQRVFKALMEYPLENLTPRFSYNEEKEAFYLGIQVFDCKFVLMKAVMELASNKDKLEQFQADLKEATKGAENFALSDTQLVADASGIRIEPTKEGTNGTVSS